MKRNSTSQSGLFNSPILVALALSSVVAFHAIFSFADAARASDPGQSSSPWANIPESFATGQGTGLVLGFDEGTNIWFAHAVWTGSPAEHAGIPVGAVVLSIGGIALPAGAIAKEPSALTEIESRLGAAASVGSIAVGWQDSVGVLHYDHIRFEALPDLYLGATVNGGIPPVPCYGCSHSPNGASCVQTNGVGSTVCEAVGPVCVTSGGVCVGIGPTPTPPPPPQPPPLSGVVSRMTHGSAGTLDIDLPQTGTRGVECRTSATLGAGNYTIVFTFVNNVTNCGLASTSGGSVSNSPSVPNGNQCTVNLTGVSNAQYITVTLTGAADSAGNAGNVSTTMGVLIGDVNATGLVDGNDVSAVQAHTRQTANSTNFVYDVNATGSIDGNDVSLTQGQTRTSLPSPP